MSEDSVREKERYKAREREEVIVRKQRERKAADIKATRKGMIRQINC